MIAKYLIQLRQSKLCRKGCCQPPYDVTPLETAMPLGVKGRRSYPLLRLGSYKPMAFWPWVIDRPLSLQKKSVPSRLLLPSKKHLQDVEHHIRKCFVLRISGFGHRKHTEKSLRSFDRSCRQIAPCLPAPAFQKSAKQPGPAKNDGGPSSAAG